MQKKYFKKDGNFTSYKTGRLSTDYVTNVVGQMNTCVVCGLEYSMEEALTKRWPLYEGHCEQCGRKRDVAF